MSLQTRVIVSVLHPNHNFAVSVMDRGARFRDVENIKLVADELVAAAKRRHGESAIIVVTTREA